MDRGIDYCLIMRDPLETLVSQYLQIRKDVLHPFSARANAVSARRFLLDDGFVSAFEDVHARHLYAVSPANYEILDDDVRTADLSTRRARLEAFADTFDINAIRYAGSMHTVAQVYERVCTDYDFVARDVPRLNATSVPLPPEIEDLMDDLADYSPVDRRLIDRFSQRNGADGHSDSLQRYTRQKYAETAAFPIDSEYFMRDWHPAEPDADGAWARWSAAKTAEILVPVTDRLRAVTMTMCVQDMDTLEHLEILMNGEPQKHQVFRNYDSPYFEFFVHVDIHKTDRLEPFSTLTLSGVKARRPCDTQDNGDPRLLGVYLRRMSLIF